MITEVSKSCSFPNYPKIFSLVFSREFIPEFNEIDFDVNYPAFDFYLELYTWDGTNLNSSSLVDVLPELSTEERLEFIAVLKSSLLGTGAVEIFTPNDNMYTINILRISMTTFEMTININGVQYKGYIDYELLININNPLHGMLQRPAGTEAELHEWSYIMTQYE